MIKMFTIVVVTCLMLFGCQNKAQQTGQQYAETNFDDNWMFQKGPKLSIKFEPDSNNWKPISLPHTTQIENKVISAENDQWQGISFYKKQFFIPKDQHNKILELHFGAAMNRAEVWLNDTKLSEHNGGYLPFVVNLTQALKFGQANIILVKLDNTDSAITGPQPLKSLDFNMYGGLYRSVKLVSKPLVHVTDPIAADIVSGGGIFISTPVVSKDLSVVSINTHINNASLENVDFAVKHTLLFDGEIVHHSGSNNDLSKPPQLYPSTNLVSQLNAGMNITTPVNITVSHAKLWSPQEPNLYTLRTQLWHGDMLLQQQENTFGFREFTFNEQNELLINGKKTFLRGVNYHQDYPYIGYAKSDHAEYRDAKLIKEAGFDFVRLSHYPHSPAFLDAADKLGLVLLNPILGWQYYQEDESFKNNAYQRCRDLIRRDRNHPSVLGWECSLNETEMPEEFANKLHSIVKQEITGSYSAGWQPNYDIYIQSRQHAFKYPHDRALNKPYLISEYGDWEYFRLDAGVAQPNWHNIEPDHRDSRQLISNGETRLLQQVTNIKEAYLDNRTKHPVADGYWAMFDYNRGKFTDLESSGIASIDRQLKPSYYFFQSQRSPIKTTNKFDAGPMVYIASNWDKHSSLTVQVFHNAERIELFLNDILIDTVNITSNPVTSNILTNNNNTLIHPPAMFTLDKFIAGTLTAKAYIGQKQVAQHSVTTAKRIAGLRLQIKHQNVPLVIGDTVFVDAIIVDVDGNQTIANDIMVEFVSDGDITIVNPENHIGVKSTRGISTALITTGSNYKSASLIARIKGTDIVSKRIWFK
ncbi:glycoside hydrolase family 2 [Psychrosphaera sp. B3R10]|uniref:glycoside hydrolase family 2 protein n=1 Tax=unclassified Psychrosphaera TaxID=2641570 RepID=UPI001C08DE68|nr:MULTISPECIES: glycoside hydrolase family 2 TIM barrel-domain containing protein [unclassified Psychrosphaera]MBU2881731.1 glycoside hydrolase family 2 [Psychrosphaera sp. I2R16]MBU2990084.1 glycoside hydrolase family 2 [Psychrosphaera sp. B3R10]